MRSLAALAALGGLGAAHFTLTTPKSIGFNDDQEGSAPCGGFTPDLTKNLVDFHVDGEAVAIKLGHQQNWLFRGTLNEKAEKGWVQLFPIVEQQGLGDFCEPQVPAPGNWAGKKGVVNVVSSAPDGLLYQCIAVNFVSGSGQTPSECKNASTVKASFTSDAKLSALVGAAGDSNSGSSSSASSSGLASATGFSAASATSSGAAAPGLVRPWSAGSGWGAAVTALAMAVAGALMM